MIKQNQRHATARKVVRTVWLIIIVGLALSAASPAIATPSVFNPECTVPSLRASFTSANGNGVADTIVLPPGCRYLFTDAISLAPQNNGPNALPVISNDHAGIDLTIEGNGAILERSSTAADFRLLSADTDVTLIIKDVTVLNGHTPNEGAGIHMLERGSLSISGSTFRNNASTGAGDEDGGGALFIKNGSLRITASAFEANSAGNGGAIKNLLTDLQIDTSTFNQNSSLVSGSASNGGGAIAIDGANPGGIRRIAITATRFTNNVSRYQGGALMSYLYGSDVGIIQKSTFASNQALEPLGGPGNYWGLGGAMWLGGGGSSYSYALEQTTVNSNLARRQGGGIYLQGDGAATISNSTVSSNQALLAPTSNQGLGGGLFLGNGANTVAGTTIAYNQAGGDGGGIFGGKGALRNSIIAHNTANNGYGIKQNCAAGGFQASPLPYFTAGGPNLEFPPLSTTYNNAPCAANSVIGDPGLGSLANNGGPTLTHALQASSPAVNRGTDCLPFDQRAYTRPDRCDLGAYEVGGSAFAPTSLVFIPLLRH